MFDDTTKREAQRLFRWGSWVVLILGIFLLAETLLVLKAWQGPGLVTNSISVSGVGEAYAVPDVATFTFSVSADAKNVSDAQSIVTGKVDSILADLKNLGIEDKDIQTNDYSVYPKYTYLQTLCTRNICPSSRQVADGYTVTHGVLVKVRKTDDAGKALAAAGAKGATNVSGLSFATNDPNQAQNEAQAKAIDDAKAKAEVLASHLGVRLVRVIGYYDNNSNNPTPVYEASGVGMMKAANMPVPTIPVGQSKVTASVTVNYEIK